mgnify:CR=1 FL=1
MARLRLAVPVFWVAVIKGNTVSFKHLIPDESLREAWISFPEAFLRSATEWQHEAHWGYHPRAVTAPTLFTKVHNLQQQKVEFWQDKSLNINEMEYLLSNAWQVQGPSPIWHNLPALIKKSYTKWLCWIEPESLHLLYSKNVPVFATIFHLDVNEMK